MLEINMFPLSRKTIKSLCQSINFYPKRSSGQNFLVSEQITAEIIEASRLKKNDMVLEIGPGLGFMTSEIAKRVRRVIGVELDRRLADYLQKKFVSKKNIEIIREDIFKLNLSRYFCDLNYKLVSNLPYNITSLVLRNFLSIPPRPKEMTLTLQKEVAERIVAEAGGMSLLSVVCQFYSLPRLIKKVGKENFWPQPAIDSALLRLEKIGQKRFKVDENKFFKVVKTGFQAKRKKLTNNFKNGLKISPKISEKILRSLKLSENSRAQELKLEDWLKLSQKLFDIGV